MIFSTTQSDFVIHEKELCVSGPSSEVVNIFSKIYSEKLSLFKKNEKVIDFLNTQLSNDEKGQCIISEFLEELAGSIFDIHVSILHTTLILTSHLSENEINLKKIDRHLSDILEE